MSPISYIDSIRPTQDDVIPNGTLQFTINNIVEGNGIKHSAGSEFFTLYESGSYLICLTTTAINSKSTNSSIGLALNGELLRGKVTDSYAQINNPVNLSLNTIIYTEQNKILSLTVINPSSNCCKYYNTSISIIKIS